MTTNQSITTSLEKLKWQMSSETSVPNIFLCIIIWKLFGGWIGGVCALMIFGNIVTLIKSISHLGSNYFKSNNLLKEN